MEATTYAQRGTNILQGIFKQHFAEFAEVYESSYAATYGKYRLERIEEVAQRFVACGDYSKGIARIQCTNPDCRAEYFRPFSCKGFQLCPSCSQKRTLLFAEYLSENLLLRLPHRMVTFAVPKMLRMFFRHDRRLFADLSILIFDMLQSFFNEAAASAIQAGGILAYQSFGEFLRWNPHVHAIILEGGFDSAGRFIHIPFGEPSAMTECFRRRVIKLFLDRKLISSQMAENLLCWRHSGFSIDASVRISATDKKQREALAQYIARPPVSLKKIPFQHIDEKIAFHTDYNQYFKQNLKFFTASDFIAELTQHIPPAGVQYIRRYGIYSSRGRGLWNTKPYLLALAPQGEAHGDRSGEAQAHTELCCSRSSFAWARLIAKVYEVDPLICSLCGSPMRVLAVITDTTEVNKILRHLVNIGRPPPGLDPACLN